MKFSILVPHYKNGKATAHCIYKLIQHKGRHDIDIIVINNHFGDHSVDYFAPLLEHCTYLVYPKDKFQSHGIAFDYILLNDLVKTNYFITLESDSYPTEDNWLDGYENYINNGVDCAGSVLGLSGGTYIHPCGAMYSKDVWHEAKEYCEGIKYTYFPNMNRIGNFDYHLMVHNNVLEKVLSHPSDFFDLASGYKGLSKEKMLDRAYHYSPTNNPFHNGMGKANESINTYGQRNFKTEVPNILLDNKPKLILRVGYEPGQWLSYFLFATGKNVISIPTEVKWIEGRENQQQEYTEMDNGFRHIWAGSSYLDMKNTEYNDVYEFKKNQIDELYNSIPEKYKIKEGKYERNNI